MMRMGLPSLPPAGTFSAARHSQPMATSTSSTQQAMDKGNQSERGISDIARHFKRVGEKIPTEVGTDV